MVVIGLDIGKKRIGVAKWTPESLIVTPVRAVEVKKPIQALNEVSEILHTHRATTVVLGYPLSPSGQTGEISILVQKWRNKLKTLFDLPIELWDERMTSKQAERELTALGISQKSQRTLVDVAAAMHILDSWLRAKDYLK